MNYIKTETTQDKSSWSGGEWKNEADYYYWIDESTRLDCLIVRNHCGALCGYVGLPKDHLLYGMSYQSLEDDVSVHGGLTYSRSCEDNSLICHHTEENDVAWWIGFDTAHSGDYCPAMFKLSGGIFTSKSWETYRNVDYVTKEVEKLAQQLNNVNEQLET